MSERYFEYETHQGYIDTWLVAGPRVLEVPDLERFQGPSVRLEVLRHYDTRESGVSELPVERRALTADGVQLPWEYVACREDHFVDLSGFYHLTSHLRAWAFAQIVLPEAAAQRLIITTNGPADVWIDGTHVHRHEHIHHQVPASVPFTASLRAGVNNILVRIDGVAARECPFMLALQLPDAAQVPVRLPTDQEHLELRASIERLIGEALLERDVYDRDSTVVVRWPGHVSSERQVCVRLQDTHNRIYVEALPEVRAGTSQALNRAVALQDGEYNVVLMPHPEAFYVNNVRVTRSIPLTVLKNRYSSAPYGTYAERRAEALADASTRGGVYAEIAKMERGAWGELDPAVIDETIDGINRRRDCSDFYLIGLLGALLRYGEQPAFGADLRRNIEDCALGFRYWSDEPGADAMWFWSENHRILFHACEVLAGQIWPDQVFSNSGMTGAEHRAKGEGLALDWLRERAAGGFREWDSNTYFEHDVLALTHLADLAETDQVRELSAVILDKLLYTMALNSFKGAFGSTHGRAYTVGIKGARRELTSGIGRLLWGQGVYNEATLGTVALACAANYELPQVIAEVATARMDHLWSREHHAGNANWELDRTTADWAVDKVTYKTADYMLCSAQDLAPGTRGVQQHVWQATLSHDAVVFVTHPPCLAEDGSHRPNAWHGNVVLPRVAQWHDTLIALHAIPPGADWIDRGRSDVHVDPNHPETYVDPAWMGFTHAYFPVFAFDEYRLRDGWAFARVGDGYLALTAANGLTLITTGANALRELRSPGWPNVWVCAMGRAEDDGDFVAFQERVLARDIAFNGTDVRCQTARGEQLAWSWNGPLLVDGREQRLHGFKHYESPIATCELNADFMDIAGYETVVRLDFKE
ncbi:MAG TPA: hypothetical protein VFT99_16930 [Roseiflexaceae bacterium]|nr:hypothetical protein [Roseiflexaceae bacterium]